MTTKQWSTSSFLTTNETRPNALIILNTPLVHDELFQEIWRAGDIDADTGSPSVRLCADGGANRLYDRYAERMSSNTSSAAHESTVQADTTLHKEQHDNVKSSDDVRWLPDVIKGDFDSLQPDVRRYYEDRGVTIIHDEDQFSTDLGKCVSHIVELERDSQTQYQLIIVGGLSGRLDQTVHTLHALMQLEQERDLTWAVGEESIACVLGKGDHKLAVSLNRFGKTCGILPLGQQAYVTTSGLEWDLGPTSYMFPTSLASGVSTSNHLVQENIAISTDVPIVFTAEVRTPQMSNEHGST
ncbi:thiamine pyrophosphokinase [Microbotryomycetes sp. JL221]|nr:thiamine pyrophosphokinase [Microbotryomycetes sp. JL221]